MSEPDAIAAVTHNVAHVAVAQSRLTHKLQGKAKLAALLASYMTEVQALEDAAWQLYTDTLDTAVGDSLDVLGRVLGERRDAGLSDDVYRDVLRATVLANRSNGTGDESLAICVLLFGQVFGDFTLEESFPAGVLVEPAFAMRAPDASIRVLRKAKVGGVKLQLIDPPAEAAWFTFAVGIVEQPDNVRGWGDAVDDTLGGRLVEVMV